jgi:CheY-like chemotaxis protein
MARILVLEDEPTQRFVMSDLLARSGHESRCTADPQAAMAALEEFKPDVLVADWLLKSQMTGRDVAAALRSREPNLSLVFITALPAELVEAQAADLQPFRIVHKPCEFYDLLLAIHEALGDVPVEEPAAG